jgi:hypothetical protein
MCVNTPFKFFPVTVTAAAAVAVAVAVAEITKHSY